jgi:hypothetical protein
MNSNNEIKVIAIYGLAGASLDNQSLPKKLLSPQHRAVPTPIYLHHLRRFLPLLLAPPRRYSATPTPPTTHATPAIFLYHFRSLFPDYPTLYRRPSASPSPRTHFSPAALFSMAEDSPAWRASFWIASFGDGSSATTPRRRSLPVCHDAQIPCPSAIISSSAFSSIIAAASGLAQRGRSLPPRPIHLTFRATAKQRPDLISRLWPPRGGDGYICLAPTAAFSRLDPAQPD